jgi:competence protein ComEC
VKASRTRGVTRRKARAVRWRREHWLGLLVLLVAVVVLLYATPSRPALQVVFLDVGQGDAVLIRSPDGQTALYDGGRSSGRLMELLERLGVTHLDFAIASHADFDHIGGLVRAVEVFPPRYFMDNGMPHTTQAYENLLAAVEAGGSTYLEANERTLTLGEVELQVLPPPYSGSDQNENSIGIIVRYGAFQAVLTGDASTAQQMFWQEQYAEGLEGTDIYKAAHHGSSTGDQAEFLQVVQPEVVVIGVGQENQYGHPHREALASYQDVGARIYRTDKDGHVTVNVPEPGTLGYQIDTGALPRSTDASVDIWGFVLTFLQELLEP